MFPAGVRRAGGGPSVTRTVIVPTHDGEVTVTLKAPYAEGRGILDPSFDLLAAFRELEDEDALDHLEALVDLEHELIRRFCASAVGRSLAETSYIPLIMELAVEELGVTVVSLDPEELEVLLLEIFPSAVEAEASEAKAIIEDVPSLYSFMGRELGLHNVDSLLRVLDSDAVLELEVTLSDSHPKKRELASVRRTASRSGGAGKPGTCRLAAQSRLASRVAISPAKVKRPRSTRPIAR